MGFLKRGNSLLTRRELTSYYFRKEKKSKILELHQVKEEQEGRIGVYQVDVWWTCDGDQTGDVHTHNM
jgi:hypothetical protein